MTTIEQIDDSELTPLIAPHLVPLLQNVVDDGASIGFIAPLAAAEAVAYWQGIITPLQQGDKVMYIAKLDEQVVGAVQLALEPRANGRHRAEVQKLMVHTAARGKGIGRQLMVAVEAAAKTHNRSLLVLDTVRGGVAEALYLSMGYSRAGIIPRYALSSAGHLDDTVFYYREL